MTNQAVEEEIALVKRSGSTIIAHLALKHRISKNHNNEDPNVLQRAYQAVRISSHKCRQRR